MKLKRKGFQKVAVGRISGVASFRAFSYKKTYGHSAYFYILVPFHMLKLITSKFEIK